MLVRTLYMCMCDKNHYLGQEKIAILGPTRSTQRFQEKYYHLDDTVKLSSSQLYDYVLILLGVII
jgi:hypothetical protein